MSIYLSKTARGIHAKSTGMLIAVRVLKEDDQFWHIHALDEKRAKCIAKDNPKNKIFLGENAVEDAMAWQEQFKRSKHRA